MRLRRPDHQAPHLVAAAAPPALLVPALIRNLASAVGGPVAYCTPTESGVVTASWWPAHTEQPAPAPDLATAMTVHGATEVQPVTGGGWLLARKPRRALTHHDRTMLDETAVWLGMAVVLERLQVDRHRAAARATVLDAELRTAHGQVARVRELERRRLVGTITTVAGRRFADVRRHAQDLRGALVGDEPDTGDAGQAAEHLRVALDDLIEAFRTVVRGVHPSMLPERGPRAALEELAAVLHRPVRFRGDLGHRVGWEVESGLYHAVAAVLNHLESPASASPVLVEFDRADGVLGVRATAAGWTESEEELRGSLAGDAQRLAVLGGALRCSVTDGQAAVSVQVPERIGSAPDEVLGRPAGGAVHPRVRALVERGWLEAEDPPAKERWAAIADRLRRPVCVAVVGRGRSAVIGALLGRTLPEADRPTWYVHDEAREGTTCPTSAPDVEHVVVRQGVDLLHSLTFVDLPGAADSALASALSAGDAGQIDAVLCLTPPDPAFRRIVDLARHRLDVVEPPVPLRPAVVDEQESTAAIAEGLDEMSGLTALRNTLMRRFVARFDVITARRALNEVDEEVRRTASRHALQREVERIRTSSHELKELELLHELDGDGTSQRWFLPHDARTEAVRLLGAHGTTAHQRLGLPPTAGTAEVRSAAGSAADRWRARSEHPTAGAWARTACEILVRTCEGLVSQVSQEPPAA
ncbi:hypothetical protein [Lentzea sp. E54]|uniref:hypothetical protein n=1 Tax=Lentzea xerophila TaxID=3435883 RepID=UPI003DA23691